MQTISVEFIEAPSAILACIVLQQMVRKVLCKSIASLIEETKVFGNECQIVRRCAFRSYFKAFFWENVGSCVYFIVVCQIYSVTQAWVHIFFISTTVESLKCSTADWLSLPASFTNLLLNMCVCMCIQFFFLMVTQIEWHPTPHRKRSDLVSPFQCQNK